MNIQEVHNNKIIEQFSLQAIPFAEMPAHMDSMDILLNLSGVKATDSVLDVACGPGLVACAFAAVAHHVTGIDITKAMINTALKRQTELQLNNLTFDISDVSKLPYSESQFDLVLTRYTFHHFINHEQVFSEMIRVCKSGGKILLADVAIPEAKLDAYNQVEKLRDPSHVSALTLEQIETLFNSNGLNNICYSSYQVDVALEDILSASFPNPDDREKLSDLITKDVGVDNLGINAREIDNKVHFSFPIVVYVGQK